MSVVSLLSSLGGGSEYEQLFLDAIDKVRANHPEPISDLMIIKMASWVMFNKTEAAAAVLEKAYEELCRK